MKKIHYILIVLLVILTGISGYIWLTKDFSVSRIYPSDGIVVSNDFPVSIIVSPYDDFRSVEVRVNGRLKERIEYNDVRKLRVGNNAFINLPVRIEGERSGKKEIEIIFNRKFLSPKYRAAFEVEYKEIPDIVSQPDSITAAKVEKFFAEQIQDVIIMLNNTRLRSEDWKNDSKYTEKKRELSEADIPEDVKKSFMKLIETFEKDTTRTAKTNASNELNYILMKSGYPVITVLLESEPAEGEKRTVIFAYSVKEVSKVTAGGINEKVYLLERLDRLGNKELFSGIITEHSPVTLVIDDVIKMNAKELEIFLNGERSEADKLTRKYTHYFVKEEKEVSEIVKSISEEPEKIKMEERNLSGRTSKGGWSEVADYEQGNPEKPNREKTAYELMKVSTGTHEAKHLADYKDGFPFAKSITRITPYFFGSEILTEAKTNIGRLIKVYDVFSRINPEYSAYLFSLGYSAGSRKYVLLKLLDFVLNEYYKDNQYHWAAKLIFYRFGDKTGVEAGELLTQPVEGNERVWVEIYKKLTRTEGEEIGRIAREIFNEDYGE